MQQRLVCYLAIFCPSFTPVSVQLLATGQTLLTFGPDCAHLCEHFCQIVGQIAETCMVCFYRVHEWTSLTLYTAVMDDKNNHKTHLAAIIQVNTHYTPVIQDIAADSAKVNQSIHNAVQSWTTNG